MQACMLNTVTIALLIKIAYIIAIHVDFFKPTVVALIGVSGSEQLHTEIYILIGNY